MRNIFLLTKNYFHCAVGTLLGKKKRVKSTVGVLIILLLLGGLFALVTFQAWGTVQLYKGIAADSGVSLMKLVINEGFLLGTFIAIFFAMQKVTGGQRANDADLLLAMPCTRFEIVTAKAMAKYFFNLALVGLLAGPYVVAYLAFYKFSLGLLFGSITAMLFVPFFAVGLACILDYITTMLFRKAAAGNLLKAGLTLAALIGFFVLYMSSSSIYDGSVPQDEFIARFAPIMWMVKVAFSFHVPSLLMLAVVALLPFVVGVALFATTFDKHNQVAGRRSVNIAGQAESKPMISVFKKELSKYINTPIWIINSVVGLLMIIGLTGWVVIAGEGFLKEMAGSLAVGGEKDLGATIAFVLTVALSLSTAMVYTSCCSISLEGRNLWILKTTPLKTSTILLGKVMLNVVLVLPVVLISGITLGIVFINELNILQFMIMLLCPILVNVFISFIGIFINLCYPKLDWESETAVVKQSMSVLITTLMGLAVAIVPIVPIMMPSAGPKIIPYMGWIMLGAYTILASIAVGITLTKGKELYEKLPA